VKAGQTVDSSLYAKAVAFACEQHRGQKRIESGGEVDYVVHPIRVAEHVRRVAGIDDIEILCAAVLHDTIEDSATRYDELDDAFGERVASIVAELTNDSRLPKAARHEDMIRRAATMSREAKLIKLADRYDNLCSVDASDSKKRRRLIEETPQLLSGLRGVCSALEEAIETKLAAIKS
jgi:guanosine-3',5'-bis(diphosphate) 3'-pyrophosphohydrolase